MLINTFKGRPVLLMDEVRVGKTLQVLGYIAMRAYLYEAHEQQGGYPGLFSEYHLAARWYIAADISDKQNTMMSCLRTSPSCLSFR